MIEELPKIEENKLNVLYTMLEKITLPKKNKTNTRRGFDINHRATTFGITRARFKRANGNLYDLSESSIKYPEIYNELLKIGEMYCPFKFTSIHVNKNVTCPKHKDSKNIGSSMLLSFGNYIGGKIVIENIEYDSYNKPIIFNGSKLEHWNTDDLQGTKYSLVFFIC